tara:strand:- start:3597 stop:4832 length:1236 start_codon:yes stop_codon:yes gene_type:complete
VVINKIYEKTLAYFAYGLLAIDTVNGFFLQVFKIDIKISILYKSAFIFIGLIYLSRVNFRLFLISCLFIFYIVSWAFIQSIIGSGSYLLTDLGEGLKLISTILIFNIFSCFYNLDCCRFAVKFVIISSIIIVFNIVMSILGVGFSSYGAFGAKGFFYGANALSGLEVIFGTFILAYYFPKGKIKYLTVIFALLFVGIVVGTKSGVLGLLLSSLLIPLYYFKFNIKNVFKFLAVMILAVIFGVLVFEYIQDSSMITRILYFYETGGLTRALLSDRDTFFSAIYPLFIDLDFFRLLFGFGFEQLQNFEKITVEIDPIDIIFIFGLMSFFFYGVFILLTIKLALLPLDNNDYVIKYFICCVTISTSILILISFVAGHILFNGFVTYVWGIVLAFPKWRYNNLNHFTSGVNNARK